MRGLGVAVVGVVVLGLVVAGLTERAVVVLLLWLGGILPYKLQRERSDRLGQFSQLSERLGRVTTKSESARKDSQETQARLAGLAPTIRRLSLSSDALDQRISACESQAVDPDQPDD